MRLLENTDNFLGLHIVRNGDRISIDQIDMFNRVLASFGMSDCYGVDSPILKGIVSPNIENTDNVFQDKFSRLIGCLMYIMLGSRPDICFAACYFSRFQNCANQELFNYLLRVLRYLKNTKDFKLTYHCFNLASTLEAFVDADWASDTVDRRSVSGFVLKVFGNVISWSSKKQNCVALSSTEAEYIALCPAVTEVLFVKQLLLDLDISFEQPPVIYEDNQSCIKIAKSFQNLKRTKHIDVRLHFIKDEIRKGNFSLNYIPSDQQLADVLTKPLSSANFLSFVKELGLE